MSIFLAPAENVDGGLFLEGSGMAIPPTSTYILHTEGRR